MDQRGDDVPLRPAQAVAAAPVDLLRYVATFLGAQEPVLCRHWIHLFLYSRVKHQAGQHTDRPLTGPDRPLTGPDRPLTGGREFDDFG
jgi:hypothetical protein